VPHETHSYLANHLKLFIKFKFLLVYFLQIGFNVVVRKVIYLEILFLFLSLNAFASIKTVMNDYCMEGQTITDPMNRKGYFYKCKDDSITFLQPSCNAEANRSGLCGGTAGVNLIKMYCDVSQTVQSFDEEFIDLFSVGTYKVNVPYGTLPQSLETAMNRAWQSHCRSREQQRMQWALKFLASDKDYLQYLFLSLNMGPDYLFRRKLTSGEYVGKWPLIALINYNAEAYQLHYVTVVDIDTDIDLSNIGVHQQSLETILSLGKCDVIYNTWAYQYRMSCRNFVHIASMPNVDPLTRYNSKFALIDLVGAK